MTFTVVGDKLRAHEERTDKRTRSHLPAHLATVTIPKDSIIEHVKSDNPGRVRFRHGDALYWTFPQTWKDNVEPAS